MVPDSLPPCLIPRCRADGVKVTIRTVCVEATDDDCVDTVDAGAPSESWPNLEHFNTIDLNMLDHGFHVPEVARGMPRSPRRDPRSENPIWDLSVMFRTHLVCCVPRPLTSEWSDQDGAFLQRMSATLTADHSLDNPVRHHACILCPV